VRYDIYIYVVRRQRVNLKKTVSLPIKQEIKIFLSYIFILTFLRKEKYFEQSASNHFASSKTQFFFLMNTIWACWCYPRIFKFLEIFK
jgi:hypothetical protein